MIKENNFYKELLNINNSEFDFTHEQLAFLKRNKEDTLLRAIPGSGKTTLLSYKVKQLVSEFSEINKIHCISYTNITVDDLKDKCTKIIPTRLLKKIEFSTFHSFCLNKIILPFSYLYSNRGARIYSDLFKWEQHGEDLLKYLYRICNNVLDNSQRSNFQKQIKSIERSKKIYYILRLTDSNEIDYASLPIDGIARYYLKFLKDSKLIDFNLINYFSLRLIEENKNIRDIINASFDYICIDEFQDVTDIQFKIIETLIGSRNSKMRPTWLMIGDPNQSIYGFAGARITSMFEMHKILDEDSEISLYQSFRCGKSVFEYAKSFYNQNIDKIIANADQENIVDFLKYLQIDEQVTCVHDNGAIILDKTRQLESGVCFIGSDRFDSIETYNQHRNQNFSLFEEDEYSIFEQVLDSYKDRFGYRFINLFTQYLIVKYDFQFNLNTYQESLDLYIYMLERILSEELTIDPTTLKLKDYGLSLDDPLKEEIKLSEEYKLFNSRLNTLLNTNYLPEEVRDWMGTEEVYKSDELNVSHFISYIRKRREESDMIEIQHLHRIKGLEYKETIVKSGKIPHNSERLNISKLLNGESDYGGKSTIFIALEELNKLYVMLTRSKGNVYITQDKSIFLSQVK